MINTVLGIIPARGGSKSIPRKNICSLAGKPLIAWTIETALSCKALDRVIVSTDDQEIASVAQNYGAEAPFLRPKELALDNTPGIAPILHAVQWLAKKQNYIPDYIMVLQPTSPLRTIEDIDAAIQLAIKYQSDSVISVCPVNYHPYWMKQLTSDRYLTDFLKLHQSYNHRQDLPNIYAINGAIYLVRRDILLQNTLFTNCTLPYIMPTERSLDIDTSWELYLANLILEDKNKHDLYKIPGAVTV